MWVRANCQLSENVYQVTTAVSSHFLALGETTALIDSGIDATVSALEEELSPLYQGDGGLDYILLTHAHFDHLGGVAQLKKNHPELKLAASTNTVEILSDESQIKSFYEQNKTVSDALNYKSKLKLADWKNALKVDLVLGDGDSIDLGDGVEVKAITCPGHSKDSMAYFILPDALLQAGEAVGGYHGREIIAPAFAYNYQEYLNSLDKLTNLEISGLGLPHSGCLRGDLAKRFLVEQRLEAERFLAEVTERTAQGEMVDGIVESIVPEWQSMGKVPEGPFRSSLEWVVRAMVEASIEHNKA